MFLERFVLSRGLETGYPLIVPSSVEGLHVLHPVHGHFFPLSILPLMFRIFYSRIHGPARSIAREHT